MQRQYYGTKKPFCGRSRGNVVRNCSRTAMENYSAQCRTWCGAMPKQRGQYRTHRCSPLCVRMILRTVMENCSAHCRTWCGTMPHRCAPTCTIDLADLMKPLRVGTATTTYLTVEQTLENKDLKRALCVHNAMAVLKSS